MGVGGGPIAGFGSAPAKRLSRYRVARPYRRGLRVLYAAGLRHLSARYGCLGETLEWHRNLCCGSLLRNLVDPALVASADFGVGTWGERGGAVAFNWRKIASLTLRTG